MEKILINGKLIFSSKPPENECKIFIKVLDTSFADAPAKLVAQHIINYRKVNLRIKKEIPFEFNFNYDIDQRSSYIISVHVDVDNDGTLSINDFISKQSYPIITSGHSSNNLNIILDKIT